MDEPIDPARQRTLAALQAVAREIDELRRVIEEFEAVARPQPPPPAVRPPDASSHPLFSRPASSGFGA